MREAFCFALGADLGGTDGVAAGHPGEAEVVAALLASPVDPVAVLDVVAARPAHVDPRVAAVRAVLRFDPDAGPDVDGLARSVHLSPGHLMRLFASETGTSVRRYRLWCRMMRAARALAEGADLTRAAGHAGFASPSHLSDTVRATFGLTPRALTGAGLRIRVETPTPHA